MLRTRLILPALVLAAAVGCGGDGSDSGSAGNLSLGQLCDPSVPMCATGSCQDVVSGNSCDSYSCTNWSQASNQGTICTKSCSSDADCTGITFSATNGEQTSAEDWSCSAGVCHVMLTGPPSQNTDSCSGCGGALCSGPCIGCPQC